MASGIVETSQGSAETPPSGSSRSKLLQRLLAASENFPTFVADLLTTQAVSVAGTEAAAFLIERNAQSAAEFSLRLITHIRPDDSPQEVRDAAIAAFQEIIRPCIIQGKDGAIEVGQANDGGEAQFCLVTLLRSEEQVVAVSAVITRCRDGERAYQRLTSMQLIAGYLEFYTLRRTSEQSRLIAQSHQQVLQLAGSVATAEGFESAAKGLCNELATRTGAARVSIGWVKWGRAEDSRIRVRALSHTEKFDKKQELIVDLQRAMEECVDQEELVHYDPTGAPGSQNVTRAARELSTRHGGHVVLSLPLRRQAQIVGVVTLEFPPAQRPGENVSAALAVAIDLLAPQLYDRHENDRWLITKAGLSARKFAAAAIGPKHMLSKLLVVLAILIVLVLFNLVPPPLNRYVDLRPMYRISADMTLVPLEKRSICAPFDGRIRQVFVEKGQSVKAGDLLLQLDTSDLAIEKSRLEAEAAGYQKEAEKAQSEGSDKSADYLIAQDKRDATLKQAALIEWKIQQAAIRAGIDGTVTVGDWKEKIDSGVNKGDVLFEIAQPHKLKAELLVADREVQMVHEGQRISLATTGLPQSRYGGTITRIVPLGEPREGGNYYRAYADLDQTSSSWAPGLTGEARIDVQRRTLAWIWTHRVVDWLRLKLWM